MRLLYSTVLYILAPLFWLRLLWRSHRLPGYRAHIRERFGFAPCLPSARPVIWVHAVSVGEFLAARPLIDHLLTTYPSHLLLVTTATPTARELVGAYYNNRVHIAYAPLDLPDVSRRFVARVKPQLLVLMETELWPNWLQACGRSGCKVLLANGRLSERSATGYRRAGNLASAMFARIDAVGAQTIESAQRFAALGVPKQALTITGNLKYEAMLTSIAREAGESLRETLAAAQRAVVVACSTHPGEERVVLAAFTVVQKALPESVLILAPRHPERAKEVGQLCMASGLNVAYRSRNTLPGPEGGVLLCDTIGELAMLCGAASSAFVGGSLVPGGGQNPLDAVQWQLPILTGPHTDNFSAMVSQLQEAGALKVVQSGAELGQWWLRLAADSALSAHMGQAGGAVLDLNRGALQKLAPLVADLLSVD